MVVSKRSEPQFYHSTHSNNTAHTCPDRIQAFEAPPRACYCAACSASNRIRRPSDVPSIPHQHHTSASWSALPSCSRSPPHWPRPPAPLCPAPPGPLLRVRTIVGIAASHTALNRGRVGVVMDSGCPIDLSIGICVPSPPPSLHIKTIKILTHPFPLPTPHSVPPPHALTAAGRERPGAQRV